MPAWFQHARSRPLSAEELVESWQVATGYLAAETVKKPEADRFRPLGGGYLIQFFGTPNTGTGDFQGGLREHLYLNNGPLGQMIGAKGGLAEFVGDAKKPVADRVERLFLATLNRRPAAEEAKKFADVPERQRPRGRRGLGAAHVCRVPIQPLTRPHDRSRAASSQASSREVFMRANCVRNEHLSRRALMKGLLATAAGGVVMNWGGLTGSTALAAEARKQKKHCILLWMNGGASQFETFDMKPGRPTGGPFRPVDTNVPGVKICELMPQMAKQMDKVAVIRSMRTSEVDHPGGIYLMHTGYRPSANVRFPEIGAIVAKYQGTVGARPAELRQGVVRRRRRGRVPRAEVPAVRHRQRGQLADVLGVEHGRREGSQAARPARVRRGSIRGETKSEVAKMHGEGVRGRPPAAEGARRVQDRRRVGQVQGAVRRQRVRPALPAGPQAGRIRGGVRRGRAEQLRLARRQLRLAPRAGAADGTRLGRAARRPEGPRAAGEDARRVDRRDRPHAAASTTGPAAITTSAAGPRPSPGAASRAGRCTGRATRTASR